MKGEGNNKGYISNFIIFIVFIFLMMGGIFFPDWLLKTEEAQAATRFYLQNAAPDVTVPTHRGAWDSTGSVTQRKMARTKSGSITSKRVSELSSTNDYDVLLLKFVSQPISNAQTISGTLNWVIGSRESDSAMNAHWHVHVYVVDNAGTTLRGTLYTDYTEPAGTNEWLTTATGDGPTLNITLTSVATQADDRIVIEVGYVARNTSTSSYTGTLWYGGTNSTDLTLGGDETTYPGWWEFSQDFFDTTPPAIGTVTPQNNATATHVDSTFDLTANVTEANTVTSCQYCASTSNPCNTWAAATVGGSAPNWTCIKTGITGFANGTTVYLNIRATDNSNNTGTGTQVSRIVDSVAPTTTDNQTSSNWQATEKTVTLTPNDGTGSGVTAATGIYGCFGTGCIPAVLGGNIMTTNCGAGNECAYDVRYYSVDKVGNTETTKTSANQARIDRKVPASGASFNANPGNNQCSFSWGAATDGGSGMHSTQAYEVRKQQGSDPGSCAGGTQMYIGTGLSTTDTGLTNDQTYYYRLCYKDNVNNQSQYTGNPITCTPVSPPPSLSYPAAPYDDGKDPDTGDTTTNFTFKLIYTDSENDAPASGYPKIYIGDNDGYASYTMSLDTSAAASLRDGNYTNGEQYVYGPIDLGAAQDSRFYFEAKAATGTTTIVKLPADAPTSYSTGPSVYLMPEYNMVGVPKDLGTGLSYSSVFGDDSGYSSCIFWDSRGLDTAVGYLGSWSDCTSGNIEKGKGYYIWAVYPDYYRLDEPGGVGNVTAASVDIALDSNGGWTMITNPYNAIIQLQNVIVVRGATEYTFSQAVTNNYIGNSIYEWEGYVTGYTFKAFNGSPPATLDPWVGYFIYVKDTTPTTLRVYKP